MKKFVLLFFLFLLTACPQKKTQKQEEPPAPPISKVNLLPTTFEALEAWRQDNFLEALPNLLNNCNRIKQIKTEQLGKSQIKIDTKLYQQICNNLEKQSFANNDDLRIFIENNFTPFLVLNNGNPEGKFTSYYESRINASFTKYGKYKYPVYGLPDDLIEIRLKDFDQSLPDKRLVGRIDHRKMIPYYERAKIEDNGVSAPVLMWTDSLIDLHIMQIQGSAVAYMNDGQKVRVGYADNNGRSFKGIGSILLENKLLPPDQINMIAIKEWLKQHPEDAQRYMQQNQRYIFHKIVNASGPIGAFGVPLQAGRSLAVDRDIIPLGSLLWLSTSTPDGKPLNKLVAAQDVGSAIKGAVRGDYFWGSGDDDVLALAGSMNSVGKYFILLPKGQENDFQ